MRRPHPSLVLRLTMAFALGQTLAFLIFLTVLFYPLLLFEDSDATGPEILQQAVATDLRRDENNRLVLLSNGRVSLLLKEHKAAWFLAKVGDQLAMGGPVDSQTRAAFLALPASLQSGRFRSGPTPKTISEFLVQRTPSRVGTAVIAAGGINSREISYASFLSYVVENHFIWVPLFTGAITFLGGLFAIPVLLRSIRPTTRAAASLDPNDLTRRLPEDGVVKQLLPLVRAVNSALDRVAEAFSRRKRFIADVAHELRTPLAVLNMHVETLPAGDARSDLQRLVFRLTQMIGQMLDAERLSNTTRPFQETDLVAVSRAAVAEIAPLAISSKYEIGLDVQIERALVLGDPYALHRAVLNILGNAIAHGGGSGLIEVRISASRIEIADEGPGVPVEAWERVFEPFSREQWDRDGCGLGLHLVREIMRVHRGEVSVTPSDKGAVFRLQFPVRGLGSNE